MIYCTNNGRILLAMTGDMKTITMQFFIYSIGPFPWSTAEVLNYYPPPERPTPAGPHGARPAAGPAGICGAGATGGTPAPTGARGAGPL